MPKFPTIRLRMDADPGALRHLTESAKEQPGRLDQFLPIAPHVSLRDVIGENEDEVRLSGCECSGSQGEEAE